MKITFDYKKEKDIWCLFNFGKGSNNSSNSTLVYKKLIEEYGENPTEDSIALFIEKYISNNDIDIQKCISEYQRDWDIISVEYNKIAESIFNISLPGDIIAYLTINNRSPYNIKENHFFVTAPVNIKFKMTVMHELWHFYTWYKFGITWEEKLGKQKYNDTKEALTVLINVSCKDLLPEGLQDMGYPQHEELRNRILGLWNETKDIEMVWNSLV